MVCPAPTSQTVFEEEAGRGVHANATAGAKATETSGAQAKLLFEVAGRREEGRQEGGEQGYVEDVEKCGEWVGGVCFSLNTFRYKGSP